MDMKGHHGEGRVEKDVNWNVHDLFIFKQFISMRNFVGILH